MNIFPVKKAYVFAEAEGLLTEVQHIRVSRDRFGVLRSVMMVALLQRKALLDKFIADWWPNGSSLEGRRHLNAFARIYKRCKKSKKLSGTSIVP
jgi:hypothetical protein